jgi:hypothetical protein
VQPLHSCIHGWLLPHPTCSQESMTGTDHVRYLTKWHSRWFSLLPFLWERGSVVSLGTLGGYPLDDCFLTVVGVIT